MPTPHGSPAAMLGRIYAAGVHPEEWEAVARDLSDRFGGAAVAVVLRVPGFVVPPRGFETGLERSLGRVFRQHAEKGLPWGSFQQAIFVGRFGRSGEVFPDARLPETEFYQQWMAPQGLAPEGPLVNAIAVENEVAVAGVAIYRRVGGRAFTDQDIAFANRLVPHFERAYVIHCQLSAARGHGRALAESTDRMPTGLLLLDAKLRAVRINRSARKILDLDDGLRLEESQLRAANPSDHEALQRQMAEAARYGLRRQRRTSASLLTVERPSGKRPLSIMVAPLLPSVVATGPEDAVSCVYVTDPEAIHITTTQVLETLYHLTHAEAEIVRLLSAGRSLEEAAKARRVSINTVRSQLKQVFLKTDTRRQGDLVRLVLSGVAPLGSS